MIRPGETWQSTAAVAEAAGRIVSRRDAAVFRTNAERTAAGVAYLESAEWRESHWSKTFIRQLVDETLAASPDWIREYMTDAEFHAVVDQAADLLNMVDAALSRELSPTERERVWRDVLGTILRRQAEVTATRRRLLAHGTTVQRVGGAEFVIGDSGTFERLPASLVAIPPAEVDPLLRGDAA